MARGEAVSDIKLGFWIGVGLLLLGLVMSGVHMILRKA